MDHCTWSHGDLACGRRDAAAFEAIDQGDDLSWRFNPPGPTGMSGSWCLGKPQPMDQAPRKCYQIYSNISFSSFIIIITTSSLGLRICWGYHSGGAVGENITLNLIVLMGLKFEPLKTDENASQLGKFSQLGQKIQHGLKDHNLSAENMSKCTSWSSKKRAQLDEILGQGRCPATWRPGNWWKLLGLTIPGWCHGDYEDVMGQLTIWTKWHGPCVSIWCQCWWGNWWSAMIFIDMSVKKPWLAHWLVAPSCPKRRLGYNLPALQTRNMNIHIYNMRVSTCICVYVYINYMYMRVYIYVYICVCIYMYMWICLW